MVLWLRLNATHSAVDDISVRSTAPGSAWLAFLQKMQLSSVLHHAEHSVLCVVGILGSLVGAQLTCANLVSIRYHVVQYGDTELCAQMLGR